MITGVIDRIIEHGTIVELVLNVKDGWGPHPKQRVYFDHRMFQNLVDGEGGGNPTGRMIEVESADGGEVYVTFLD